MSEPRFKVGDKAELEVSGGQWAQVSIKSPALRWVSQYSSEGNIYLVKYADPGQRERLLVHEEALRPVERWEPCPGRHRVVGGSWEGYRNVERLVERPANGGEEEA
jgi:hypothetical protein